MHRTLVSPEGRTAQSPGQHPGMGNRNVLSRNAPRRPCRLLLWSLLALAAFGCAGKRVAGATEPRLIIVRNRSGVDVTVVSLQNVGTPGTAPKRMGSVSPVPRNVSQLFYRQSTPPPLPKAVEVSWADSRGGQYARQLSLEPVIRMATGKTREALVLEIRPQGEVVAFVEQQQ